MDLKENVGLKVIINKMFSFCPRQAYVRFLARACASLLVLALPCSSLRVLALNSQRFTTLLSYDSWLHTHNTRRNQNYENDNGTAQFIAIYTMMSLAWNLRCVRDLIELLQLHPPLREFLRFSFSLHLFGSLCGYMVIHLARII